MPFNVIAIHQSPIQFNVKVAVIFMFLLCDYEHRSGGCARTVFTMLSVSRFTIRSNDLFMWHDKGAFVRRPIPPRSQWNIYRTWFSLLISFRIFFSAVLSSAVNSNVRVSESRWNGRIGASISLRQRFFHVIFHISLLFRSHSFGR